MTDHLDQPKEDNSGTHSSAPQSLSENDFEASKPKKLRDENPRKTRKNDDPRKIYEVARLPAVLTHAAFFRIPKKISKEAAPVNQPPDNQQASDEGQGSEENREAEQRKNAAKEYRNFRNALRPKYPPRLLPGRQVALYSSDEEVLIGLLAIAAATNRRSTYSEKHSIRRFLNENESNGPVISIEFSRAELAQLLGWGLNKRSYELIFDSLVRLSRFEAVSKIAKEPFRTRIIAFPEEPWVIPPIERWLPPGVPSDRAATKNSDVEDQADDNKESPKWTVRGSVRVLLCAHLSEFVLDAKTEKLYGLHFMTERRELSPLGRTLYTQIVAQVRPGQKRQVHLDSLLTKLKRRPPTANDRSTAIQAISHKFLLERGWKIEASGRSDHTVLHVLRPPLPYDGKHGRKEAVPAKAPA